VQTHPPQPEQQKTERIHPAAAAAVVVLCLSVYLPTLHSGFVWDDHALVDFVRNGDGQTLWGCLSHRFLGSYYRPVVSVSLWLDMRLWGPTPMLFHQTNLLLHLAASFAVMGFARTLLRSSSGAAAAALLYAVHPAHAASVGWVGGRTDTLFALFSTLFLWGSVWYAQSGARRACLMMWLGFAAALFTKEQALALLPMPALSILLLRPAGSRLKPAVLSTLPLLFTAAVYLPVWSALGRMETAPGSILFIETVLRTARSAAHYTGLLLLPTPGGLHTLSLDSLTRAAWAAPAGGVILFVWCAALLLCRRSHPQIALVLLYGGLVLLPVLNLIPVPSLPLAPYRAASAVAVPAILTAWLVQRLRSAASLRLGAVVFLCAAQVPYSRWAALQWSSDERIYTSIAAYDPDCLIVRHNLATLHVSRGRLQLGRAEMETLLSELFENRHWDNPAYAAAFFRAQWHLQGRIRRSMGPRVSPDTWVANLMCELGSVRMELNLTEPAERVFRSAAAVAPKLHHPWIELATLARAQGRQKDALNMLNRAVLLGAGPEETAPEFGILYMEMGKAHAALAPLRLALRMQPRRRDLREQLQRAELAMNR
jgi:tetratricopeptide (TPR) repeat protein